MSVTINSRVSGDVSILDLAGKITLGDGSALLRDKVKEMAAAGKNKILVDLGDVNYIDSSGIGELVSAYTTISNNGGDLKLVRLNKRVQDLLQITKLYTVFEIFDEEEKALQSF